MFFVKRTPVEQTLTMNHKSFVRGLVSGMQPYVPSFFAGNSEEALAQISAEIEAYEREIDLPRAPVRRGYENGMWGDWQRIGGDFYNAIGKWQTAKEETDR